MSPKSIVVDQKKKRRPLNLGIDVSLLVVVIILLAFGLLMLYSASWQYSVSIMGEKPSYLLERQITFVCFGGIAAVFAFFFDYHKIKKFVVFGMIVTLIMLLVIFYIDEVRLGARRGLFQGSIQPSEMAKLMIIIYLSFWLFSKQKLLHHLSFGLFPMAAILGITIALIILQPDLSAAITIFAIGGLMFFMAGGEMRQIIPALIISLVVGLFLVLLLNQTGEERITDYILGLQDPDLASYHIRRSFEAIVNGGVFGVGIGRANTKFTGLPVAPTDSIFSIVVEETGIVGASFVIFLFILFLWRGLAIAKNSQDLLGQLLAAGISIWIFLEAFINMSGLVNLLPFAGNALPFFSLGGSNLTVVLAGVGIIMGIARQTVISTNQEEGRPLNAVVSVRRDDGWRSVSRSRRSSSSGK